MLSYRNSSCSNSSRSGGSRWLRSKSRRKDSRLSHLPCNNDFVVFHFCSLVFSSFRMGIIESGRGHFTSKWVVVPITVPSGMCIVCLVGFYIVIYSWPCSLVSASVAGIFKWGLNAAVSVSGVNSMTSFPVPRRSGCTVRMSS